MDTTATPALPHLAEPVTPARPDRLGAEVRDSLLLLTMSVSVTAGLAAGLQGLLSLLG